MFDHSIKVPRLYKTASKVAREVSEGKGSIKQLVYESKHPNIKGLYALVVNTFQKTDAIEKLLKKSKLLVKEPRFDLWLAKILITELLWGKKRLTGDSKPVKTILAYEQILKAHISDVLPDSDELKQVEKPRYVRVNSLKISVNEAIDGFKDEGWVLKRYAEHDYLGFLDAVANLGSEEFMIDIHVPNLLIFPPRTQFYQHPAYNNGSIILQDKASCLPVQLLNPQRGATILDMCAAPGMKTTQTAAVIENDGLIYAVEVGTKRYETLTKIVESSGATCVKTINRDVLTMTDKECPGVEYILVDPSCSGSGITDRIEIGQQKWDEHQERLGKLAAFQITMLRHALTKFPKAKRVVYSTCSVYPEENEDVVRQVLETCTRFKLVPANDFVKQAWINFGSPDFGDIGKYCLYAKPDMDLTSGFFVAVFEKVKKREINQFLNSNMFLYSKRIERKRKVLQNFLDEEAKKEKNPEENEHSEKKKKKDIEINETVDVLNVEDLDTIKNEDQKRKKKKKKKDNVNEDFNIIEPIYESNINEITEETPNLQKKKKKKHKCKIEPQQNTEVTIPCSDHDANITQKIKKDEKKHKRIKEEPNQEETHLSSDQTDTVKKNKKKKKKKKYEY